MLNPDFIFLIYNSVVEFTKSALIILFQGDHLLPGICSSILAFTFYPKHVPWMETHLPMRRPKTGEKSEIF